MLIDNGQWTDGRTDNQCYFSCDFSLTVSVAVMVFQFLFQFQLCFFQLLFQLFGFSVTVTVILNIYKFYKKWNRMLHLIDIAPHSTNILAGI